MPDIRIRTADGAEIEIRGISATEGAAAAVLEAAVEAYERLTGGVEFEPEDDAEAAGAAPRPGFDAFGNPVPPRLR